MDLVLPVDNTLLGKPYAFQHILRDDGLRKPQERELSRLVGTGAMRPEMGADTANIHDRHISAPQQQRQKRSGDQIEPAHVDRPRALLLLWVGVGDGFEGFGVAGIVDEDVEAAGELVADLLGDVFDVSCWRRRRVGMCGFWGVGCRV